MRVGILTYYGVHNHGAVLQANALKNVLQEQGCQCGFLSFERDYSNLIGNQANKYKLGLKSVPFYVRYLFKTGIGNILYNIKKKRILDHFRKEYIPMTGNFRKFTEDLVVIGSDEVFSLEIGVNPFLFGNDLKAKHVISYAGSFGPTTYEDVLQQKQKSMISDGLHHMDAVSVRDHNSQEIVKMVAGIDAALVCDPVILYGYKREMLSFVPPLKNYILVYSYDKNLNNSNEYGYIQKYAQKNHLKIVSVGYYHRWCKSINASPFELLGWIKNATMVVTDTFHGAVMSIICNTPAVVKLRGNQNKLEFLLSEYGLKDRVVTDFSEMESVAEKPVNFDRVNAAIEERRSFSMKYLDEALESCNR